MPPYSRKKPKIALALGSGSARGWAHIGVIKALESLGIKPQIICGTSIGALVGSMYATGNLETLEKWILKLDRTEIIKYLDLGLLTGGGFVEGSNLISFFRKHMGDQAIEDLAVKFACVATDLENGQEIWIQEGSILQAIRASMALPGLFTPVKKNKRWLVDGGLVNPVPVSVCRALGADKVIAVNLNGDIVGKHLQSKSNREKSWFDTLTERTLISHFADQVKGSFPEWFEEKPREPGLFEVLAGSINIMQDRITRSRMAGDPADIMLAPKLASIGLMEFDRAEEAILAGEKAVIQYLPYIKDILNIPE